MALSPDKKGPSMALLIVAMEGRNFVSLGIRPEALRTMRYYCQIVVEDVKTSDILFNVRTNRVQRETGQANVVWNEDLYFEFPHNKKKKNLELKVMCFEHSPLHDHFQGEVVLPLGHLHQNRPLDQWYALARRDKKPVYGEVHLKLELGVDIPDDYVRRSSSLDGNEPESQVPPDFRTTLHRGVSAPDRVMKKKSLFGIRNTLRKTSKGVRGYFSDADGGGDDGAASTLYDRTSAVTEGEEAAPHHHQPRSSSNSGWSEDRFLLGSKNSGGSEGGGMAFGDEEESIEESDHSEKGDKEPLPQAKASFSSSSSPSSPTHTSPTTAKKQKTTKTTTTTTTSVSRAKTKRSRSSSAKRPKAQKEGSLLVLTSNEGNLLGLDESLTCGSDGGAAIDGWPPSSTGAELAHGSSSLSSSPYLSTPSSLSSSPGHVLVMDEGGAALGRMTPAALIERLAEEADHEETTDEAEGEFDEHVIDTDEAEDALSASEGDASASLAGADGPGNGFGIPAGKATRKASRRKRQPADVVMVIDEASSSSDTEAGAAAVTEYSPFKRTIKRGGMPATPPPPATVDGSESPLRRDIARGRSTTDSLVPRLKLSGDGAGGGYASASRKQRPKSGFGASQRLALLQRFPTYENQSKAAIIDQRQRAYHVWLEACHRDMDEFFDDTRQWKLPIGAPMSEKLDYAALEREWKRPWRKDKKVAKETKDHLQAFVDDEMEGMEEIMRKINGKANSHFEQPTLFSQSAVSAMRDIAKEARKKRLQRTSRSKHLSKAAAGGTGGDGDGASGDLRHAAAFPSTPELTEETGTRGGGASPVASSPSVSRRVGPLIPTPSFTPESTGYRPLLVVLFTLLLLYILNRFM